MAFRWCSLFKPSGVREWPRKLRSVVHFGTLEGNRRSRRDGVSRASGGGVASAAPGVVSAVRMRWMVPETHEGPAPQA